MKMKRGKDSYWKVVRYNGDMALYATCKCGYEYNCGRSKSPTSMIQVPALFYRYCPYCGARKKWYNEEPINTGIDIADHYKQKYHIK